MVPRRVHTPMMALGVMKVVRPSLLVVVSAVLSAAVANFVADPICDVDCIGILAGGLLPMYVAMTLIMGIVAGILRTGWPLVGWVVGTIYGVEMVRPDGIQYSIGGGFVAAVHFAVFLPAAIAIWVLVRRRWRRPA